MNITLLTNEYPPNIYGGAGVHVEYLTKELVKLEDASHTLSVLSFGEQNEQQNNLSVRGITSDFTPPSQDPRHAKFMDTLQRDLIMAGSVKRADIVHCHTWYTHLAGCLVKQLTGAKLLLTTHSLEPHRPWKVEQLGTAYFASTWLERTAYQNADGVVAVSESMKSDVHELYDVPFERTRVIPNGIDLDEYKPKPNEEVLERYGVDPSTPYVLFVGRITRQKGILHLVNAIKDFRPGTQVVLCAGAPDTEEIAAEMTERVETARAEGDQSIVWVRQMVPRGDIITLYTHAALFVCPSVYEPFGIINLEAMACETPVVASAVGGIPEIIVDGETGSLVPFERVGEDDFEPKEPERFSKDLAGAVNQLLDDPERLEVMGRASRKRVEETFGWQAVARETLEFYKSLL